MRRETYRCNRVDHEVEMKFDGKERTIYVDFQYYVDIDESPGSYENPPESDVAKEELYIEKVMTQDDNDDDVMIDLEQQPEEWVNELRRKILEYAFEWSEP